MSGQPTMIDLFSAAGLTALRAFIDRETLFAFDLDGTLAPIVADPDAIRVPQSVSDGLVTLIDQATVAVITGRSLNDALAHLEITPHFIVGNHGAEGLPGHLAEERAYREMCAEWERQTRENLPLGRGSGIRIENKGATLALHYRAAPDREKARGMILGEIDRLVPQPRRVTGKCVENIVPMAAPDKGAAMLELMRRSGCRKGFYVGDDATDEDVFRLEDSRLFTVRVGEAASRARYLLRGQEEMNRLLREICGTLADLPDPP